MTATAASDAGDSHEHLTSLLNSLVDGHTGNDRVSVGEILDTLKGRALAVMIFLFAAPTALPMPPGFSTITAVPLLFLTAQLMLGMTPWLPAFVTKRSVRRSDLRRVVKAAEPWIARAESAMRPRFPWLVRERLVGLVAFILAVVLVLPIPGGNFPPSVALCLLSLGILERDGLWVAIGVVASVAATVLAIAIVWAILAGGGYLIGSVFG